MDRYICREQTQQPTLETTQDDRLSALDWWTDRQTLDLANTTKTKVERNTFHPQLAKQLKLKIERYTFRPPRANTTKTKVERYTFRPQLANTTKTKVERYTFRPQLA